MLKVKNRCFQNVFMIIRLKCFHDSVNIVVILATGHEHLSYKCAPFPLTFTE